MVGFFLIFLLGVQAAHCSIKFSPTTHSGKPESFTVSWTGIEKPPNATTFTNDIVALYPSAKNPLNIATAFPIAYVYPYMLNESAWSQGSGSYKQVFFQFLLAAKSRPLSPISFFPT